jgi:hypothetical protein
VLHQNHVASGGYFRNAERAVHIGGRPARLAVEDRLYIQILKAIQRYLGEARRRIGIGADDVATDYAASGTLCGLRARCRESHSTARAKREAQAGL